MGKIIELFPGEDGLLRVVKLQTKDTTLKRPIHRLVLLPIENTIAESNKEVLNE